MLVCQDSGLDISQGINSGCSGLSNWPTRYPFIFSISPGHVKLWWPWEWVPYNSYVKPCNTSNYGWLLSVYVIEAQFIIWKSRQWREAVSWSSNLVSSFQDSNAQDKNGWTPVHAAAYHGRLGCLQYLARWGGNIEDVDNVGNTPGKLSSILTILKVHVVR
jgi:hypothetical protein